MQTEPSGKGGLVQTGSRIIDFAMNKIISLSSIFDTRYAPAKTRQERLKRTKMIGYVAVLRSGAIGAIASAIPILILYKFILVQYPHLNAEKNDVVGWNYIYLISAIIFISLIATILELLLLYYDAIRAAGKMNQVTRRDVLAESEVDEAIQSALPMGLTKAALGMNRDRSHRFGINPMEKSSKTAVAAKGAAYRAQVILINAMIKRILRRILARMFGRTVPRAFLEWILLPIYVIWNMVGATSVMNELICRANGSEATKGVLDKIGIDHAISQPLSIYIKNAIQHHVHGAKAIHPNIELIILSMKFEECDFSPHPPPLNSLNELEQQQLSKFILTLPYLETRRTKLHPEMQAITEEVFSKSERKQWIKSSKAFIHRGIEF
ncbi:MAG: hypothetical protein O2866_03790 [archaeon]|nr:hypothetical protein [archaeon]MDA1167984.1 hypothetical protein [archaeon]